MIDSVVWKEKLEQDLRSIKKRLRQNRWPYRSIVLFERELTLVFFSIRSLIEAGKLTDACANKKYECITYPNNGKVVDEISKYWPSESFDFGISASEYFPLKFLTNQFIHAYVVFLKLSNAGSVNGILLCSDQKKQEQLILITTDSIVSIVQDVINDEVKSMHYERNQKTGELRKTQIS